MTDDYLFELLPRYYRWQDAELTGDALAPDAAGPLQRYLAALQGVVFDDVRSAIGQLYDNLFIETCEPWVIPYIGDLVGLGGSSRRAGGLTRSQVANAIRHQARKGLAITITEAVEDATGWPAHVDAAVDRIGFTQSVPAPAPDRGSLIDVRDTAPPGAPLDRPAAHFMDVRGRQTGTWTQPRRGSVALQPDVVAVSVWPTQIYPMKRAALRAVGPGRYTFNPLGVGSTLVGSAHHEVAGPEGPAGGLSIYVDHERLDPADVTMGDLDSWEVEDGAAASVAVVDPTNGRLRLRSDAKHVAADFAYGLCGDIGGGPYLRGRRDDSSEHHLWVDTSRRTGSPDPVPERVNAPGLREAIGQLGAVLSGPAEGDQGRGIAAVITIADNEVHVLARSGAAAGGSTLRIPDNASVTIRAENGYRPCLVGDLTIDGGGRVVLDGCTIAGSIRVAGPISLDLRHCTVANVDTHDDGWPGDASVVVGAGVDCHVTIADSIMGPLAGSPSTRFEVADSTVDGGAGYAIAGVDGEPPPQVHIQAATVLGMVAASHLDADGVLFMAQVTAVDPSAGGARRSYFAADSKPPLLTRGCVHAGMPEDGGAVPTLISRSYGTPGYAQLSWKNADVFLEGGIDGGEIGVFNKVRTADRLSRMQWALDRFVPIGLQAVVEPVRL